MSDIWGNGWGDDHDWKRGGTNQVGSADPWMKASYYACSNCGESFAHSYDMYPDIFYQMQVLGISEHCPKADTKVITTASSDLSQAEGSQNVTKDPS